MAYFYDNMKCKYKNENQIFRLNWMMQIISFLSYDIKITLKSHFWRKNVIVLCVFGYIFLSVELQIITSTPPLECLYCVVW